MKNKGKSYSMQAVLTRNLSILIITALISLLIFGIFSYQIGLQQIKANNTASLNVYATTLQTEMSKLEDFTRKMCYNDTAYQLLSTNRYTDSEKIVYENNLRKMLQSEVSPYSGLLVFSDTAATSMYEYGSFFPAKYAKHCYELKEELKKYYIGSPSLLENWQTYSNEFFSVIMYTCQYNGLYLCSLIDMNFFALEEYASIDSALHICFFNDEQILSNQSEMDQLHVTHEDLVENKNDSVFNSKAINSLLLDNTSVSIACCMSVNYFNSYFRIALLCIFFMLIIFIILSVIMFLSFRDTLSYPVTQIISATESIEQNDISAFVQNNHSNIIEFQKINKALSHLIEQKVELEKQNQLEKFEKNHAMLQYFQLQTRSHFFINCLKSLYNMLQLQEYEKMQRMILAFSNHLRYIFHDNLKVVPLRYELDEVNDYYNIILLDRSKPILLMQKVDDTLSDFPVPPLLIQTFLENSIKYNTQSSKLLCFSIQIEKIQLDNGPFVLFKLTDNGIGYEQSMLEKLNCEESDLYEDYHVGITNLKKRIQLIYKSDFQLTFYNEPTGGACTLIYLPLLEEEV